MDSQLLKLKKLREEYMEETQIDALLLTHLPHIAYLSGFTGSNALLFISHNDLLLVTDSRYEEQAKNECPLGNVLIAKGKLLEHLAAQISAQKGDRFGFLEEHANYRWVLNARKLFNPAKCIGVEDPVAVMKMQKLPDELRAIRSACKLTDRIMQNTVGLIRPGMTEAELAAEIVYHGSLEGSQRTSFDPIVVSGPRSSLIHGTHSQRRLRSGDTVLMDFGFHRGGYASDMTRTVFLGKKVKQMAKVYDTVHSAYMLALDTVEAGMPAAELDRIVREYIAEAGYGEYFQHALGHGLGMEVHERPIISGRSTDTLENGCVFTIEPGIYIPGAGGVRIENTISLQKDGPEELMTMTTQPLVV